MKILFIHPKYRDYRTELFEKLNEKFDIVFLFLEENPNLTPPPEWNYKMDSAMKIGVRGWKISLFLVKESLKRDYDIIITSTTPIISLFLAKLTGKKFVLWTEYWCWASNTFLAKFIKLLLRFVAIHSDAVIATGTKSYEFNLNLGISNKKIFTYPQCAVDFTTTSTNRDLRKELQLGNKKIILYLSRIVPYKGLDYLIEAFALLEEKMDDVFLLVAGDGYFRKECEDLAKNLGIQNALFMGHIDDITKVACYKACDIFVLPSIVLGRMYEAWGLVINEAMAFGKPIVTTDAVGATEDLIKEGYNGFVIRNRSVTELFDAMYKILSDQELMDYMGSNSRTIFGGKNNYGKMIKAFANAIDLAKKE